MHIFLLLTSSEPCKTCPSCPCVLFVSPDQQSTPTFSPDLDPQIFCLATRTRQTAAAVVVRSAAATPAEPQMTMTSATTGLNRQQRWRWRRCRRRLCQTAGRLSKSPARVGRLPHGAHSSPVWAAQRFSRFVSVKPEFVFLLVVFPLALARSRPFGGFPFGRTTSHKQVRRLERMRYVWRGSKRPDRKWTGFCIV